MVIIVYIFSLLTPQWIKIYKCAVVIIPIIQFTKNDNSNLKKKSQKGLKSDRHGLWYRKKKELRNICANASH